MMRRKQHCRRKRKMKSRDLVLAGMVTFMFSYPLLADELVHKFKSPSFSGIGASAHYLTIENQEKTRRDKIADDIEAALLAAEREADNSTLAKFMRNLESRIYAQLSKQLVEQLFSGTGSTFGSFVLEGNTITYQQTICDTSQWACVEGETVIVMTIVAEDGSTTEIVIPIGAGTFAGDGDGG
jgi:hypothetical protein